MKMPRGFQYLAYVLLREDTHCGMLFFMFLAAHQVAWLQKDTWP